MPRPSQLQRSLHGKLAHQIGRQIVQGALRPGDALPTEDRSMMAFQVSRTAYREAIKMLTAKGLVDSRPRRGTRVRPRAEWNLLDPDLLDWISDVGRTADSSRALLEMRQVIEPQIAGLAAVRRTAEDIASIERAFKRLAEPGLDIETCRERDAEFHCAIAAAAGNEMFGAVMNAMRTALMRGHGARYQGNGCGNPQWLSDHDELRRAVVEGDHRGAMKVAGRMLGEVLGEVLGEDPPQPGPQPASLNG